MRAALELLSFGISLKHSRTGEQRAPCPRCDRGPKDTALAVKVDADGTGATWCCHRCGWTDNLAGERVAEAADNIRSFKRERKPDPDRHETLAPWALNLWRTCQPITEGTLAATYLARRGCILPPWPDESDLRWHDGIKNWRDNCIGPALVGRVTDAITGEARTLHYTWIRPDGTGKADIGHQRLTLPRHGNRGVVRIWPDAEVTLGLVIGEGVETCLAAARMDLTPVWATINAKNLSQFPVLPGLSGVTVLVDHDWPNPKTGRRAGIDAAAALVQRYTEAGFDPERDVVVILPPTEGQDAANLAEPS